MRLTDNLITKFKRRTAARSLRPKKKTPPKEGGEPVHKSGNSRSLGRWIPIIISLIILGSVLVNFVLPSLIDILSLDFHRDPTDGNVALTEWNGNSRLILLLAGIDKHGDYSFVDAISLLVVDPENKTLGIFGINPDINIFSQSAGRAVNLRTVFNNKYTQGKQAKVLIEAIENLVAVRIDRYALVDSDKFVNLEQVLQPVQVQLGYSLHDPDVNHKYSGSFGWNSGNASVSNQEFLPFISADANGRNEQLGRNQQLYGEIIKSLHSFSTVIRFPSVYQAFVEAIRSNLSKQDSFFIAAALWGIRSDQIKTAYTKTASLIRQTDLGVYPSYEPAFESIDRDLANLLYNFKIAREQPRIEVLNASVVRGLASSRSRWVTNSGGRVVYFGNSQETEAKTKIYITDPEKYPNTLHELERIFNGKVEYVYSDYIHKHIGDIIVVIGDDYQ
jgi:anionic cell wall polymer biosynthesis LytR-Cps2A-Psr (LCP) family protein